MRKGKRIHAHHDGAEGGTVALLPSLKGRRLVLTAVSGTCLNVECFRGFAAANVLGEISRPDVYLQYSNPDGTQRDLSLEKARRAYEYMAVQSGKSASDHRFFTEVVLNIRDQRVVKIDRSKSGFARLTIFLDILEPLLTVPAISRVEGNHRLALVSGSSTHKALSVPISFCITVGVSRTMEAKIFRDINSNQRPMNTSHLDSIDLKIGPRIRKNVSEHLRIADRLGSDPRSPFLDLVYRGGRRPIGTQFAVSLRTLANLNKLMLSRSAVLQNLDFEEKYAYIRDYWTCVATIFSREWNDASRRYIMMKSAGLSALAMLGAATIDLSDKHGRIRLRTEMLEPIVEAVDWSASGDLSGLNGLGGANIIFQRYLLPGISSKDRLATKA